MESLPPGKLTELLPLSTASAVPPLQDTVVVPLGILIVVDEPLTLTLTLYSLLSEFSMRAEPMVAVWEGGWGGVGGGC